MRRVQARRHHVARGRRAPRAAHHRHAVHGQAALQQVRAPPVHAEPPAGPAQGLAGRLQRCRCRRQRVVRAHRARRGSLGRVRARGLGRDQRPPGGRGRAATRRGRRRRRRATHELRRLSPPSPGMRLDLVGM